MPWSCTIGLGLTTHIVDTMKQTYRCWSCKRACKDGQSWCCIKMASKIFYDLNSNSATLTYGGSCMSKFLQAHSWEHFKHLGMRWCACRSLSQQGSPDSNNSQNLQKSPYADVAVEWSLPPFSVDKSLPAIPEDGEMRRGNHRRNTSVVTESGDTTPFSTRVWSSVSMPWLSKSAITTWQHSQVSLQWLCLMAYDILDTDILQVPPEFKKAQLYPTINISLSGSAEWDLESTGKQLSWS